MTAKEYLGQVPTLRRQMRRTAEKVEEIETIMQSVRAIRYDKINVQSSPDDDQLATEMIRLEAAREMLIQQAADYNIIYATIRSQIDQMQPQLYRDLLTMRYLDELSWNKIAAATKYSDAYIRNAHGKALQEFGRRFLGSR